MLVEAKKEDPYKYQGNQRSKGERWLKKEGVETGIDKKKKKENKREHERDEEIKRNTIANRETDPSVEQKTRKRENMKRLAN